MKDKEEADVLADAQQQAEEDKAFADAVDQSYRKLQRLRLRRLMYEQRMRRAFERRLYQCHRQALDLFEHFLATCEDLSEEKHTEQGPRAERERDHLYFALARIQARASLTASEISALIRSGHASGALARWRTLHELAVIAVFLQRHGIDAAERYMASERVKTAKEARKYNLHWEALELEPLDEQTITDLEQDMTSLVEHYGEAFKDDWGWASEFLPKRTNRPTFTQLEEAVGLGHWQPHVGMANHAVHGGFKGMMTDIGAGGYRYAEAMLSGPSMYGLIVPAEATLQDLFRCTKTFLLHWPGEGSYVRVAALWCSMREARETFIKLERRLTAEAARRDH